MYSAKFKKYTLQFYRPSGTSRGIMTTRDSWFFFLTNDLQPGITGIGECGPLKGLSLDDGDDFENKLAEVCGNAENFIARPDALSQFPSIRFGLEMALHDFIHDGTRKLFPSPFTDGNESIPINGLVWMGSFEAMLKQVREKIESGYDCIKLKIGAINFEDELQLIRMIRKEYGSSLEIRLDANGAFRAEEALEKLKRLSVFQIHSVEQPIAQGQWTAMAELCSLSPIPIALDEELIRIADRDQKENMLRQIKPQFIILKPGLLGGFKVSEEWIALAESMKIGWWVTSALESNIGLNAIAQWTYTLQNKLPQGLGTGQLFSNNFSSPLKISRGRLFHHPELNWDLTTLLR